MQSTSMIVLSKIIQIIGLCHFVFFASQWILNYHHTRYLLFKLILSEKYRRRISVYAEPVVSQCHLVLGKYKLKWDHRFLSSHLDLKLELKDKSEMRIFSSS